MHFAALPDLRAQRAPEDPCVGDDAVELTNAQFLTRVVQAARVLREHGVGPGDVVGVILPNGVEFVVALFAAWRLGASVTPINPRLTEAETGYQIADSGAVVVITPEPAPFAGSLPAAALRDDRSGEPVAPSTDPQSLALIIYTSGSTGRSKGVLLDHANVSAMGRMLVEVTDMDDTDHSLLILPLFHINGIMVSLLMPLLGGARVTVTGRFQVDTFFDYVERVGPTFFSAVPTMFMMLAELPEDVRPDCSSIRFSISGGAPLPPALIERFERRYDIPIHEAYGMSESTCVVTVTPLSGPRKPGAVGLPLPGVEVAVVGLDGRTAAAGETGEVVLRGPNVMRGYLGRPEETSLAVQDGWLHTGDVGRIDEDGYLVLVDRIKDMIIRGGVNIYPKEIETVLGEHPDVFEAAVVGAADTRLGEVPVAFVVLRPDSALTTERLLDHCGGSLAKYKHPVDFHVVDALPRNHVGKIDKPALRARLGRVGADR
ncbi:AMP-binding protein [Streptomyces sp. NPDC005820]|uniref:class I adenylate-forming enzyme family protein n=1 Tax=Streptomyces sp. NPDC005820 TaxID=3157069 RepID=UPI0033F70D76